ncbi:MAG: MFS transporter [Streptosporangiales bacterium]|nr:MFS transporter [Streptosporangiales bacterium]
MDTRPLRHADYRRLWAGQGVSFIGYQLTQVAVPVQVYDLTHSSFWVGMVGLASLLPLIAFGLWGGAVADAMDRRRLLIMSSCTTWATTWALLLHALVDLGSVPLILTLVAVQSVGFAVSSPTRYAIIPRLIPTGLVPAANTLNFVVSSLGTVAGPLIAGIVLGSLGFAAAYGIDAALFTAGLYAALRLPRLPPLGERTQPGLRAVIDGLVFLSRQPVLLMSFVVDIIAMVLAMPRALFPEVADTRFGGEAAVGWLFASIAIGAVAGGLLSGWIGRVRRQGVALIVAIAGWGIAVAVAGLARDLWLAVLLLSVAGAADLVSAVYRQTILQTYAPDEMRGRLQGVFIVVVAGGPRLGDLRAGATAAVVGATVSWVGGGVLCAVAVVIAGLLVPSFLRYDARRRPFR